jgi:hypothetical protein
VEAGPLDPHGSTPAELRDRLAAEREGLSFVVLRDGDGRQQLHPLPLRPPNPLIVGRGAEADVRVAWDAEVSRVHARLACHGGAWYVEDDGLSANGTWVNGEPVRARRRLEDGDSIRVGHTAIAFRAPVASDEEATVRAADREPPRVSDAQRRVLVALARPYGGGGGGGFATPATNQAIAGECFLTVDAVKAHLRALFERFGIADLPQNAKRVRLVELALLYGVVGERDYQPD